MSRLRTSLCGIELESPVLNGSGTYDALVARDVFGEPFIREFPFAAFVSKTITLAPRAGNPPNRLWETPSGMINSIGLPNPGLDTFLERDLPRLSELPVPLVVSVMADRGEDFARLVSEVADSGRASAIELNVSCPNVHSGLIVGEQPTETEALMGILRPLTEIPLIVKLTPNVAAPEEVARAAEAGGADGISMINTLKAWAADPESGRSWLGAGTGGLSGPAVRPVALAQVRQVSSAVAIPVIGMGGITDGESAFEFIAAGATAVAVGTENFRDPAAGGRISAELERILESRELDSVEQARRSTLT